MEIEIESVKTEVTTEVDSNTKISTSIENKIREGKMSASRSKRLEARTLEKQCELLEADRKLNEYIVLNIVQNGKTSKNVEDESAHRSYILTINNATLEEEKEMIADNYQYIAYQWECESTVHIQAFLYYASPRKFRVMKNKYPRAHIEVVRNNKAAAAYCIKEKTRIFGRGPFEWGTKPNQGARTDLDTLARDLINGKKMSEIREEEPGLYVKYFNGLKNLAAELAPKRTEKPEVTWIWGDGGVGKTKYVIDKHGADNVYRKDMSKWWDKYKQQEAICIDDFNNSWDYTYFLNLLDRYQVNYEVKNGHAEINSKYIYITCEFHPKHFWGNQKIEDEKNNKLVQVMRRIDLIKHITRTEETKIKWPREEGLIFEYPKEEKGICNKIVPNRKDKNENKILENKRVV